MSSETKENIIFIVASLINLADMAESELREVAELAGVDAIQKLIEMGHLRYELDYEEMAKEICNVIGWEPVLGDPWRRDEDLSRLGLRIAETIDSTSPVDEDVAERLFNFLSWEGIGEWFEINGGAGDLL